jgi:hypothetical protein
MPAPIMLTSGFPFNPIIPSVNYTFIAPKNKNNYNYGVLDFYFKKRIKNISIFFYKREDDDQQSS